MMKSRADGCARCCEGCYRMLEYLKLALSRGRVALYTGATLDDNRKYIEKMTQLLSDAIQIGAYERPEWRRHADFSWF